MFKLAKEAYKVLNGMENRKIYDIGIVKSPPRGWYRDLDKRKFRGLKPRGAFHDYKSISGLAVTGLDGWSKDQTLPTGWKLDMVSNK